MAAARDTRTTGWELPCLSSKRRARRLAKAAVAQGARAGRTQLHPPQGSHAAVEPPLGVRGGALPQRRGVLGGPHRDLHDPGRRLHAQLRLLRGDARAARLGGPRGARARGARRAGARPRARRDHVGEPRRPRRRRGRPLRGDDAGRPTARAWVPGRAADPRLPGRCRVAPDGDRRGSGRAQPQHGDGAASLQGRAARRAVRAHARPVPSRPSGLRRRSSPSPGIIARARRGTCTSCWRRCATCVRST